MRSMPKQVLWPPQLVSKWLVLSLCFLSPSESLTHLQSGSENSKDSCEQPVHRFKETHEGSNGNSNPDRCRVSAVQCEMLDPS